MLLQLISKESSVRLDKTNVINKKFGGTKLIYVNIIPRRINFLSKIFGNKLGNETYVFWKPLKIHLSNDNNKDKKFTYEIWGNDNSPFTNGWYLINKNFQDIKKDITLIRLKGLIIDKTIIRNLNNADKIINLNSNQIKNY
jgi:hypothetical protein